MLPNTQYLGAESHDTLGYLLSPIVDTASWQGYHDYYWSSITRPETRSLVGQVSKCFSQDTGCRDPGCDSGKVVDWSLRWVFHTRIDFEGYRGKIFPRLFEPELQLFRIRQVSGTASQKVVEFNYRN